MSVREELVTTKMRPEAIAVLRIISAVRGEKQYSIIDEMVLREAERIGLSSDGVPGRAVRALLNRVGRAAMR